MAAKYIPFSPNSPVYSGMFAGRDREIKRIDENLLQTKNGNPTHMLIVGERGIGKSSLMLVANYFAKGKDSGDEGAHNFLTIQLSVSNGLNLIDLAVKINREVKREFQKDNKAIGTIQKFWGFLKRFEAAGVAYKANGIAERESEIVDDLIYSIADTIKALTTQTAVSELGLVRQKDGILLLIDEVDNASRELHIGTFLKNLTEKLVIENCSKLVIILAGLPRAIDVLRESHESALRLFEEFELLPLTESEVKDVIESGIEEYNNKYENSPISVDEKAFHDIYIFSEGYPHFVQQIGASVFLTDDDNHITSEDVDKAMFKKDGALDIIGDRYYKDLYYNRIKGDSYRRILKIMAQDWSAWVSKEKIKESFKGKSTTLDNGIKALCDRNIILKKEGTRGQYRLQWASFAFWIKNYTKI